jgi:hypothetical protein
MMRASLISSVKLGEESSTRKFHEASKQIDVALKNLEKTKDSLLGSDG